VRSVFPNSSRTREAASPEKAIWIDLLQPTAEEIEAVQSEYGLKIPTRAQLDEIETSSRLRVSGRTLYLSMPLSTRHRENEAVPTPVGFVLSPDVLVTVRYVELHAYAQAVERIEAEGWSGNSASVFALLLEEMVDVSADMLERIAAQLGKISRRAFKSERQKPRKAARANLALREMLSNVGDGGEHLSEIRESLMALQRITAFTAETAGDWLPAEIQTRLKSVRNDLSSLIDFESHLSGKVQFLLDAILGFINTEQNDIFKVLTIASVVGIPPTLVASMYGMNFRNMPELSWHWGYAYGLGLIALSTIIPVLWFKRRGWW
jgi:magnesium transporter